VQEVSDTVTFFCFLPVVCIIFSIWLIHRLMRKSPAEKKRENLINEMRAIYMESRTGEITKAAADKFFKCMDEACAMQGCTRLLPEEEIGKMASQITMILALHAPAASLGNEIDKLATLRKEGMISDLEFQAFSERFKLSTGEKARDIIKAISDLYEQHKKGAMTQGNFHAGLWTLLDKLDRKT
jgi:hypothetical protein